MNRSTSALLVALIILLSFPRAAQAQYGNGVYTVVADDEGGFTVSGEGLHTWGFAADTLDAVGFLGGGFTVRYDRDGNYVWKTGEGVHSMSGGMALLPGGGLIIAPREKNLPVVNQAIRRMEVVSLNGEVGWQQTMGSFNEADLDATSHGICSTWDRYAMIDQSYTNLVYHSLSGDRQWMVRFEHPDWMGSAPVTPVAGLSAGCALARVYRDSLKIVGSGWQTVIQAPLDAPRQWVTVRSGLDGQLTRVTVLPEGISSIHDLESDAQDNLYMAGSYSQGGMVGDTREGSMVLDDGFENNGFVAKQSADGTLLWVRNFDDRFHDSALGLALDDTGDIVVVGYGNAEDHPWSGHATGMIKKYTNDGELIWSRHLTPYPRGTVYVRGVDTGPDGEIVVGGTMWEGATDAYSGMDFSGNWAFIARYDAEGVLDWARGAQRVVLDERFDPLPRESIHGAPWPNPADDVAHIVAGPGWESGGTIILHDMTGRERMRAFVPPHDLGGIIKVRLADLPVGIYAITFEGRRGRHMRMIVKR